MFDIWITFSCGFEGKDHTYDFQTLDKATPPRLKVILEVTSARAFLPSAKLRYQNFRRCGMMLSAKVNRKQMMYRTDQTGISRRDNV
jgi:hypothetical protein